MTPKETYIKTVVARINGDRKHGWGVDDSMAVIEAIWEQETGDKLENPELRKYIRCVINPSAHRIVLEGEGMLDKQESKREKREKLFGEFTKPANS